MNKLINPNMHKLLSLYTNLPKQLLFIKIIVYALLQVAAMMEIFIFKIPEYYGKVNMPLTILMYINFPGIVILFKWSQNLFQYI